VEEIELNLPFRRLERRVQAMVAEAF